MPPPIATVNACFNDAGLRNYTNGAILYKIASGLGGGTIRDTNIHLYQQNGVAKEKLLNSVYSQICGTLAIDLYSDQNTVDIAVDSVWQSIFDVTL
jgi:hypothetical protein